MDSSAVPVQGKEFDFSYLFETELAMFAVAGQDGFFKQVNPAFERLLGRTRRELLEHSLFEFVHPSDIPKTLEGLSEIEGGRTEVAFENRFLHRDGSTRWLSWVARFQAERGLSFATARDVTEYRLVQEQLQEVQQRLNLALSVANAGSWDWNIEQDRLMLDASAEALLGLAPNQFAGGWRRLLPHVDRRDRHKLAARLRAIPREDEGHIELDLRLAPTTGDTRHLSIRGRVVARDRRQRPLRAVGIGWDSTGQKAIEEQLLALVMHDPLTGVRNRRSFDQTLRHEWRRCARAGESLAALMIDVDEFKKYNDTYGHQSGDECLSAVARALGARLQRPADLLARYGGEEFSVLLPSTTARQAADIAGILVQTVRDLALPHRAAAAGIVTVSIGVGCTLPTADGKVDSLLAAADIALYAAKAAGRNRVAPDPSP